jgi:hypothetical protein
MQGSPIVTIDEAPWELLLEFLTIVEESSGILQSPEDPTEPFGMRNVHTVVPQDESFMSRALSPLDLEVDIILGHNVIAEPGIAVCTKHKFSTEFGSGCTPFGP